MKTDAILISSISNITFYTGYSGFSETEREAFLLLYGKDKFLLTDSRYTQEVEKIKGVKVVEAPSQQFLSNLGKEIFKKLRINKLGVEENNLTFAEYKKLSKFAKLIPVNLDRLRIIKQKNEIENIIKACQIGDEAFDYILGELKTGVTEKEIVNKLEFFIKNHADDISFKPIIAFGKNSAVPHHHSDETKLKNNQIVLMDFGAKVNNYCSDMTRTIYFGNADNEFRKIYSTVLDAQEKAISEIKVGIKASLIDKSARDFIISKQFPNIIHSVGHGIGIEVHEAPNLSPNSKDIIKNGMVFSVEPGIYLSAYGGVRIEDIVAVREGKAQLISNAKREIIEVNDR